jgi:pSer/pThr/pTyr-binding forkhead associated (FHA) protein
MMMTRREVMSRAVTPVSPMVCPNPVGEVSAGWALAVMGEGVVALHRLPLDAVVTLGRSSEATVTIRHPSLSRHHARLSFAAEVTIEDLGSRNGTVVEGRRLPPGETRVVRPGDVVQIGAVSVTLVRARPR